MQNIYIIGNVVKDVYLRLDPRRNEFERDQNDVEWLDVAFDGSSHRFFERVSFFGGAAVSFDVLEKFGLNVRISGQETETGRGGEFVEKKIAANDYRYILSKGDAVSYISPSKKKKTVWQAPSEIVDWIFIDRSAILSEELATQVLAYLNLSRNTRLAFYVSEKTDQFAEYFEKLCSAASLIFTEADIKFEASVCTICEDKIKFGDSSVEWSAGEKAKMVTKLTSKSILAASFLGAFLSGADFDDCLLMAKVNVENSSLSESLELEKLRSMVPDMRYLLRSEQEGSRVEKAQENALEIPEIQTTAKKLMRPGMGILAADSSGGSIGKRFAALNIVDNEKSRRDFVNIFFSTPEIEKYLSGIIFFEDTTRLNADNGESFVKFIADRGIIPGVKVDRGKENIDGTVETNTVGLDGLPERMHEYYNMGLRFAKWRSAFEITEWTPSATAIDMNCEGLAKYAKICQEAKIVPIVEPEVVYDGYFTVEQCAEVTGKILDVLFKKLDEAGVDQAGCILKVNMILGGKKLEWQSTPEEVGRFTAQVLRDHVPAKLAGVVFLSGGQSEAQSVDNLRAIVAQGPFPWNVTYSYDRALRDNAMKVWHGDNRNATLASRAFFEDLEKVARALRG
jgi:fructose-bisphosphate aldolase class I